jgi:hypothetical protein
MSGQADPINAAALQDHMVPSVELLAVNLHTVEYDYVGGAIPRGSDREAPVQFSLVAHRPSKSHIIVEFGLKIHDAEMMKMNVVYRARFRRSDLPETLAERDEYWRIVCAKLAPIVMYPYIRETVHSLTSKSGLPNAILPVLNVGAIVEPASINLPKEPENDDDLPD